MSFCLLTNMVLSLSVGCLSLAMAIIINDDEFRIREATLAGIVNDPYWCDTYNGGADKELHWHLSIEARDKVVDGDIQSPLLLHQDVPLAVTDWHAIEELTFRWTESDDVDAHLYTFESDVIAIGELHFGKRNGRKIAVTWRGETATFVETFAVDAQVVFSGVEVRGNENDTDDSMRARLANYLELSNLVPNKMQTDDFAYDSGLKTAKSVFTPRR